MSKKEASVAIVLLNWNGFNHTIKCIESLRDITYNNAEVVLVDNGSENSEVEKLREIAGIKLIENDKNYGFTGGNNIGLKYAFEHGYDYLMMLNNDTIVEPGFLEPLINGFDEGTGAVQPKIYTMDPPDTIWNAGGKFNKWLGLTKTIGSGAKDNPSFDVQMEVDWITGCAMVFPARMISEIGYLDDNFFILFEDSDWSLRCRTKGYKLKYVPQSRIYHFESATAVSRVKGKEGFRSPFRQYINIRNHLYFLRKNLPLPYWPTAFIYQIYKISGFLVYYLLRGRWKKFRFTLRGVKDGLSPYKEIDFNNG
ncbi:MAG: glycosyltransferase family 2 protein [Roseivirga sp.]|jgi:hypothetical protein|uniref:glycosyltransferase family 2 protein n=1 Tax=Roseivirga sp. TaxID=1964215 RepID=UPI001AFD32CF|nr:glycosyltransferase family 2 protein [Roseivirga sp.]MBO6497572.1 glycosyltransferase family 2 protein [Roseivirga sp.]